MKTKLAFFALMCGFATGKHTILVETTLKAPKPGAPADITLTVDGKEVPARW